MVVVLGLLLEKPLPEVRACSPLDACDDHDIRVNHSHAQCSWITNGKESYLDECRRECNGSKCNCRCYCCHRNTSVAEADGLTAANDDDKYQLTLHCRLYRTTTTGYTVTCTVHCVSEKNAFETV